MARDGCERFRVAACGALPLHPAKALRLAMAGELAAVRIFERIRRPISAHWHSVADFGYYTKCGRCS